MPSLKHQLAAIDESYLIGLANKGLVNRANKEIDGTDIELTLDDMALEAKFQDGTIVTITDSPGNYECSCPSRNICKHVLMVLTKASQQAPHQAESLPSFDFLLEHTRESLIKEFGKKVYGTALERVLDGSAASIEEGARLTISIVDDAVSVTFLPGAGLGEAICTCKAPGCAHRLEAFFHFVQSKTGELLFEPIVAEVDIDMSIIPQAKALVEDIYRTGLFRLPGEYSGRCSQFATLSHGAGFASLERLFETAARQLALYEAKNADFDMGSLTGCLGAIHRICVAIAAGGDNTGF